MKISTLFASVCVGVFATVAAAVPPIPSLPLPPLTIAAITNQLAWDGMDGQLSMELPGTPVIDSVVADDFYLGASASGNWQVREARVLFLSNRTTAPAPGEFRLRVFRDTGRLVPRAYARPGTTAYTRLGATRVIDRGSPLSGYRLYEVAFDLPASVCTLPARNWYWMGVDHVGAPGTSQYYLATFRQAGLNGAPGRVNQAFPTGTWGAPLFAPSDFAVYVRSTTPAVLGH